MRCCGIRGAITVESNTKSSIASATRELLSAILSVNHISVDDIAGVWFTTTSDLNADFPAVAARELGLGKIALLCGHEMSVPDSLKSCLRVMLLVNTEKKCNEIVHVYLKGAKVLRPDLDNYKG